MNFFAILKILLWISTRIMSCFFWRHCCWWHHWCCWRHCCCGRHCCCWSHWCCWHHCGYWFPLFYQDMPAVAGTLLLLTSVIFVLFLLLLLALLLQGLCCCWRPWSPAAVFFLAVDCFASITGTSTDDAFLLAVLLIMSFLLLPCRDCCCLHLCCCCHHCGCCVHCCCWGHCFWWCPCCWI